MVVVRICGGLGNQLFQYAAGKQLSLINNTPLVLDLSSYQRDKLRSYRLDRFCISDQTSEEFRLPNCGIKGHRRMARYAWYRLLALGPGCSWVWMQETPGNVHEIALDTRKNLYLDGYWQHEGYFRCIAPQIRKEVTLRIPLSDQSRQVLSAIQSENAVSIHVRRTDYVTNPKVLATNGVCPPNYYDRAVKLICERVPHPCFFVFSDDIAWAQQHLALGFPTKFVDIRGSDQDCQDLHLMSQCRHHIIANSTFSWWGAWLNPNPNKIVIAPQTWYVAAGRHAQQIVPPEWLLVS